MCSRVLFVCVCAVVISLSRPIRFPAKWLVARWALAFVCRCDVVSDSILGTLLGHLFTGIVEFTRAILGFSSGHSSQTLWSWPTQPFSTCLFTLSAYFLWSSWSNCRWWLHGVRYCDCLRCELPSAIRSKHGWHGKFEDFQFRVVRWLAAKARVVRTQRSS